MKTEGHLVSFELDTLSLSYTLSLNSKQVIYTLIYYKINQHINATASTCICLISIVTVKLLQLDPLFCRFERTSFTKMQ